jgi:hypothetical protein
MPLDTPETDAPRAGGAPSSGREASGQPLNFLRAEPTELAPPTLNPEEHARAREFLRKARADFPRLDQLLQAVLSELATSH